MCIRDRLFSAFVPHSQEDVLQFVYGISLYTDMHVTPVAYFRQTLYVVIGYVHSTSISYFSVYDYNLAMVSVQGMKMCIRDRIWTMRKVRALPSVRIGIDAL